jgi:hypothetical protein
VADNALESLKNLTSPSRAILLKIHHSLPAASSSSAFSFASESDEGAGIMGLPCFPVSSIRSGKSPTCRPASFNMLGLSGRAISTSVSSTLLAPRGTPYA